MKHTMKMTVEIEASWEADENGGYPSDMTDEQIADAMIEGLYEGIYNDAYNVTQVIFNGRIMPLPKTEKKDDEC